MSRRSNYLQGAALLLAFCLSLLSCPAAFSAADKDALADQEKTLLSVSDSLSRKIFETKKAINELHERLDSLQDDYAAVNHSLIDVHLRLLE